jgi:putative transposase
MDFISDSISTGRKYRILNIIDQYTRESLAMEIDTSLQGERVARVLNRICEERGVPERIRMDNGTEFTSKAMMEWFKETGVKPVFIDPGKPKQNGYVESFHGKFRDECLNLFWFKNLREAREACEEWREHYNNSRGHSSLGKRTPRGFATLHVEASSPTAPSPQHEETAFGLSTVVLS